MLDHYYPFFVFFKLLSLLKKRNYSRNFWNSRTLNFKKLLELDHLLGFLKKNNVYFRNKLHHRFSTGF